MATSYRLDWKWMFLAALPALGCAAASDRDDGAAEAAGGMAYRESSGASGVSIEIPEEMLADAGMAESDAAPGERWIDVGAPAPVEAPDPAPAEEPDPAPAEEPDPAPWPEPEPPAPVDLGGRWQGGYDCVQGSTALELQVTHDLNDDTLGAEFAFGPSAENPDVPRGRYAMEGSYFAAAGALSLYPTAWLEQPEGYGMVGFEAFYDPFTETLSGYIDAPDCGDIVLERAP